MGEGQSETTEALSIEGAIEPLIAGQIVLGKYRIVGRLGVGGMAEVYEATHLQLGSPVALKLPLGRAGSSRGAKMAARLLREAQVGASLDPERVVRVFDVGVLEDGTPIIVLERLDGESMAERLERVERVPIETAVGWVREACAGLSEAHRRGIVHRDVKPSNLFLENKRDGGQRLRILDFGIATIRAAAEGASHQETHTDSRGPIGSPPYMSPEQVRDSHEVDARTDVWALGVTLFELIAGRRPFQGNGTALAASIVSDPLPTFASLGVKADPELEALIVSCLERDPALRPGDAADLGARLEALGSGRTTPLPLPRRRWLTRSRAVGALAVAMATIVLVVASKSHFPGAATDEAQSPTSPSPADQTMARSSVPTAEERAVEATPNMAAGAVTPSVGPVSSSGPALAPVASSPIKGAPISAVKNVSTRNDPEKSSATVTPSATSAPKRSVLDDRIF